ncbi:serine/threonine-protein kinase [Chondromyces apiculatus]|nr:serine/threonine-protein kinase [Chondromyces apiculatus]
MKPGDVLADRFELERLGSPLQGGAGVLASLMGAASPAVWRAKDRLNGEPVAVKVLSDVSPDVRARFERDMSERSALEHPALTRYVTHGVTDDGRGYVVTEWLDGVDLRARLSRSALKISEALLLVERIADALDDAHTRGLVHGAVSPTNIFLPGGDVASAKLLDLGSSRRLAPPVLAGNGLAPGGPLYLAPEQAQGDPNIDARTDVFSLGSVLYECLAGRPAFDGAYALAVAAKVVLASPPSVRRLLGDIPTPVDALVGQMLSKPREARPANGAELRKRIRILQDPIDSSGPPTLTPPSSVESWGYLGDALTAAGAPSTLPKLIWLVLVMGNGDAAGAPAVPERVAQAVGAFQANAQRLHDGSVLVRIEHERGGTTPSSQDVGVLASASSEDDPAHEQRRHGMILGMLRRARMQSQGGERAARCGIAVRGAMQGRAAALTLVPPSRPGEWLSTAAIDLAARLLDRGMRSGMQGIILDEEGADLINAERFNLVTTPGGLIELRGEWTAQPSV